MAYEQKTWPTDQAVEDYIDSLPSEKHREEARELVRIHEEVTGLPATMWGASIIGFGRFHYKYKTGHEGETALAAFSPRKAAITLYLFLYNGALDELLSKLGKHKASKGCVYVNKLTDIDLEVLKAMIAKSVALTREMYPETT